MLQEPIEWLTAFGRSPECRSYAQVYQNGQKYTFSDCGSRNTIIQASERFSLPTQIPPGVFDRFRPLDYACCGNCTLIVPEVRLLYFPDQTAPQCENQSANSSAIKSARAINKRVQSLNNTGTIAVLSGHTFTSPSVYLQVIGTAAIKDECGSLGPMLANPIITLPPNVLSTYVPPYYSIGSTYTDPNVDDGNFMGHAEPLTIADLQCPTFGLGTGTSADGSVHTTVGPPWLPIIIPPPEVFTLDPIWESVCTNLASYYVFMSFAIFDPPLALVPESYLVAPSPAASFPNLKGPPHIPANPTATYDPPAKYSPDLSDPPSSTAEPIAPSLAAQEPPANAAQPAAVPLDPAAKPTTPPDPPTQSPPESQEVDNTQSGSPAIGTPILSALGKSNSQPDGSKNADPTHIIPVPGSGIEEVTLGGQILSVSPSGIYLSGTSYLPGGPAITLSDVVFSLVSTSPTGEATTPDENASENNHHFIPSVQTIAGQNVVSNTSGVYVAGSSLSPGGSAITASNTVISLSPAGTLVIGSSSIALSLANTLETSLKNYNFDGVTVQAEPSAAVVDGIAFTPVGPGTVIDGNSISLEQSGILNVGTSSFALPAIQETTSSIFNLNGMTFQDEASAAVIDGITLKPGVPGVSVDGNRISLEQDRTLDIGTSHFALPPAAQETPPNGFNLNGMTIQAQQSAVVVNGTTLTPGAPGATINGSSVSLESGGTLDIGTGRFAIPTGPVNGTSIVQTFEGAQDEAHRVPCSLGFAAILVTGLCIMVS